MNRLTDIDKVDEHFGKEVILETGVKYIGEGPDYFPRSFERNLWEKR